MPNGNDNSSGTAKYALIRQGSVPLESGTPSTAIIGLYYCDGHTYATFIDIDPVTRSPVFIPPPAEILKNPQRLVEIAQQLYDQGALLVLEPAFPTIEQLRPNKATIN